MDGDGMGVEECRVGLAAGEGVDQLVLVHLRIDDQDAQLDIVYGKVLEEVGESGLHGDPLLGRQVNRPGILEDDGHLLVPVTFRIGEQVVEGIAAYAELEEHARGIPGIVGVDGRMVRIRSRPSAFLVIKFLHRTEGGHQPLLDVGACRLSLPLEVLELDEVILDIAVITLVGVGVEDHCPVSRRLHRTV